jgi:hypothetical protein
MVRSHEGPNDGTMRRMVKLSKRISWPPMNTKWPLIPHQGDAFSCSEAPDYTRILSSLYSSKFPFSMMDYSSRLRLILPGEG